MQIPTQMMVNPTPTVIPLADGQGESPTGGGFADLLQGLAEESPAQPAPAERSTDEEPVALTALLASLFWRPAVTAELVTAEPTDQPSDATVTAVAAPPVVTGEASIAALPPSSDQTAPAVPLAAEETADQAATRAQAAARQAQPTAIDREVTTSQTQAAISDGESDRPAPVLSATAEPSPVQLQQLPQAPTTSTPTGPIAGAVVADQRSATVGHQESIPQKDSSRAAAVAARSSELGAPQPAAATHPAAAEHPVAPEQSSDDPSKLSQPAVQTIDQPIIAVAKAASSQPEVSSTVVAEAVGKPRAGAETATESTSSTSAAEPEQPPLPVERPLNWLVRPGLLAGLRSSRPASPQLHSEPDSAVPKVLAAESSPGEQPRVNWQQLDQQSQGLAAKGGETATARRSLTPVTAATSADQTSSELTAADRPTAAEPTQSVRFGLPQFLGSSGQVQPPAEQPAELTWFARPESSQLQQLQEALTAGVQQLHSRPTADGGLVVKMQLYPKELGEVRVDLKLNGATVTAKFEAASPEAVQVIKDSLPQLRTALSDQGFSQVSLGAEASAGGFAQSSDQRRQQRTLWQAEHGRTQPSQALPEAAESVTGRYQVGTSRVDYRM